MSTVKKVYDSIEQRASCSRKCPLETGHIFNTCVDRAQGHERFTESSGIIDPSVQMSGD